MTDLLIYLRKDKKFLHIGRTLNKNFKCISFKTESLDIKILKIVYTSQHIGSDVSPMSYQSSRVLPESPT